MGGKWSTEIQVKRKMLQVQVGFEFFQPNWSFNVDKKKPQEYCWYAKAFFCKKLKKNMYEEQSTWNKLFKYSNFYLCAKHTGPRRRCWLRRTANEPGWTESKSCRTWWQCKWRILRMPARTKISLIKICKAAVRVVRTYQSLVFEWIVDTSKKQPEGP